MSNNTTERGTLRITTFNGGTVRFMNCEFAGKRGKTCEEMTVQVWAAGSDIGQLFCDLRYNMAIQLDDVATWAQAKQFAELAKALKTEANQVNVYFSTHKSIRVPPVGFETVRVGNANYSAQASYEDFSASDLCDQANDPRWISTSKQRKADFKKVYDFVKANQEKLNAPEIDFHDFLKMVGEATGVSGHYYCAVD